MAPTSSRPKITSSSFGLSTTGDRLGGTKKTIKILSVEKSSLKSLININNTLDSILKTLTGAQKEDKKIIDKQRKEEENKKRSEREKGLESKVFDGIKTAVKTVMKPFTSIWDWITNFLFNVFLGKVVMKLLDWFADPKNKDKIKSIIRFFKDWWPTMLGAYILFGTSFGKLARGLVGFAGKAVIGLGKVIYRLIAAIVKGRALKSAGAVGGAGGVSKGVGGGGWKGSLGRGALAVGGSLLAGFAIDKGVEALTGGDKKEGDQAKIDVPDAPEIPMLNAATGGLADIGKIFGSLGGGMMGSMFGPLGMLMGSMMGGEMPRIFQGLVSGKKGTDKVPAMLTDGEFVMSKGAVQKYGVDTLESMNAAGGGTNVPKIVKGIPHAAGGGLIGGVDEIRRKYDSKHGEGAYDKESERRRSAANAIESPRESLNRLKGYDARSHARASEKSKLSTPKISIPQVNVPSTSKPSTQADSRRQLERDSRKKARAEYLKVIKDMSHPDYDKAWNDPNYMKNLRQKYMSQATPTPTPIPTPIPKAAKPTSTVIAPKFQYTPYISKFAGARDAAFAKARGEQSQINPYNPMSWGRPGGVLGGPRTQARTDYAASKGKYYSSSDQKTYGNYNDAKAAQKSRMTSLASQQRLNKLSSQGAGPRTGRGIRYTTEAAASERERINRGGTWGQISRGWMNAFGSDKDRQNIATQDKASQARVKQAGAASIGRYYSSSDGKYYANYAAADKARIARGQKTKSGVKPPVKPKPKYNPAGGGMNGGRGGGSGSRPAGNTPSVKATSNSSQSKQSARQRGINR